MRRVEVAVPTFVVAIPLLVAALNGTSGMPPLLAATIVCGLAVEWFLRRRVRAWGYAERDEDLLVTRGVMVSRLSVVPYGRMQFVDVTAGPMERIFRLATVKLHTA